MSSRLLVVGAGGHGRVVADAARAGGAFDEIAFVDEKHPRLAATALGPVLGTQAAAPDLVRQGWAYVVALGEAALRERVLEGLSALAAPVTIVHPSAAIGANAAIGPGAMILAQTAVNTGSRLGRSVIVNTGATVDHDCQIGDFAHICPGAHLAGNVSVGRASWVGIGAAVRQGVRIGAGVTVGAGAAVVHDLADGVTAAGVPARPLAGRP